MKYDILILIVLFSLIKIFETENNEYVSTLLIFVSISFSETPILT